MSSMKLFVGLLRKMLPEEKPVGRDFCVVWHVLVSLAAITLLSIVAAWTGNPISAVSILGSGISAFALAILQPHLLFQTELREDYRSFLPHFPKHCYRDSSQFLKLLFVHVASLLCLFISPPGRLARPAVSCDHAEYVRVRLQHLILASTQILRAPPSVA